MSNPEPKLFGEWQPIETAPKDGSTFLAVDVNGKNSDARTPWVSHWSPTMYGTGGWSWIWSRGGVTPTHWMPLPDPPTKEPANVQS